MADPDKPPFQFEFNVPGKVMLTIVLGAVVLLAAAGLIFMAVEVLT